MFDRIIAYSIRQKSVVALFVMGLVLAGIFSLRNLPIDALPDITNNQVQILTTSPNLATQEVELLITYPIELAVKSIPDIVELRSVSRFGLSIVTVVFEEQTDIYWARNQINERLKRAEDQIPEGFGTPELAPISTGLGEIYQYTVTASDGYTDDYDAMALRSIQDWIIVPQLLGTPGVAEVNTLGGILKEYEVAVDPHQLNSMGVTMSEIYTALSRNNENTGGAYIDKKPYAYFIRGVGLVTSLEEVGKIVVKTENNIPILIRDVAIVQFGSTARYGATTKDGKGEAVSGMVMMLKGGNSAEIVQLVKDRMDEIRTTVPEGVEIIAFLDRSKLVKKAISTVRKNLIEGALIVIFILVLLIGNWRAGLIVASVIPLALLFAFTMMRLFGVSGNLMSLGAIDFGLIVDGAVIIVEAIVHRLQSNKSDAPLSREQHDKEVYLAASKIRGSAAFGEIIILIVYLPILALVGIEGKMFTPMAQTVSFAILGAFLLSLTYVPMMSALCLGRHSNKNEMVSQRIMSFFQRLYTPLLNFSLSFKRTVLFLAVLLFAAALFVFTRLGGEFIPTLSEGDIATHIIIPPGSSLQQEIATTTKAEQLLLEHFPEIEQIVSKIGSAEVPTDPMPMEVADMMVILKDRKDWTSASSKEEFFEKMEHVLEDLPGVTTEFSQPIQMRFNELMTGVRSDVGIKIFGDDIDRLVALSGQIVSKITNLPGVQDARAEAVSGFPQITIKYDKDKLALYGLNVDDLNRTVRMGFAGQKAGVVYEQEQRYDLVVRLQENYRSDPDQVEHLFVTLPTGKQIPLREVASVTLENGPAQISREEGKRRIIIGFNVRNRDVESVVEEIRNVISDQIELPVGYYIKYAGQFENLSRAQARLSVAVPIALILILSLLYFTFSSIKQSLLIFTAIPLSAIGGVFALWIRDMPFSISAGIGFIALFGVAVLNGIVMISYFNQLKSEGMDDIMERIKVGTAVRLRPVIMTAAVASFGFLPMALSTSAGAEVQKPLATVVIGGLITATLLTLVVLPILYYYLEKNSSPNMRSPQTAIPVILLLTIGFSLPTKAQEFTTLPEAMALALDYSPQIKAATLEIEQQRQKTEYPYITPMTEINATLGQLNTRFVDQSFSISQTFNPYLPKVLRNLGETRLVSTQLNQEIARNEVMHHLRSLWNSYLYQISLRGLHEQKEIEYVNMVSYLSSQLEYGEINRTAQARVVLQHRELQFKIKQLRSKAELLHAQINVLVGTEIDIDEQDLEVESLDQEITDLSSGDNYPRIKSALQNTEIRNAERKVLSAEARPEFVLGYFIQSLRGVQEISGVTTDYNGAPRFQGISLGVNAPIFGKGRQAKKEAGETAVLIAQSRVEQVRQESRAQFTKLMKDRDAIRSELTYYEGEAVPGAAQLLEDIRTTFENGGATSSEFLEATDLHFDLREKYLEVINRHNQNIYDLWYLLGN